MQQRYWAGTFVIISLLSLIASASPPPRARGTITCTTELNYGFGNGGLYSVRGPSLSSSQYAPWDEKIHEYYGDVVFFHANGLITPNIQPEFFLSIFYRVCDRIKEGFPDPFCVDMSLGDNRRMGSGKLKEGVDFQPNTAFTMSLNILSQEKLFLRRRYEDEWLISVSATCTRKAD